MIKKINASILLLLVATQGFLLLIAFEIYQLKIKLEKEYRLNSSNTITLNISVNEYFKSLKEEKEICIDGKMYDVKTRIFNNNKVTLIVVRDFIEEVLISKIKSIFNHGSKENSLSKIIKIAQISYYQNLSNYSFQSEGFPLNNHYPIIVYNTISIAYKPNTQPPSLV